MCHLTGGLLGHNIDTGKILDGKEILPGFKLAVGDIFNYSVDLEPAAEVI